MSPAAAAAKVRLTHLRADFGRPGGNERFLCMPMQCDVLETEDRRSSLNDNTKRSHLPRPNGLPWTAQISVAALKLQAFQPLPRQQWRLRQ